jgi:hypothetical protein
MTRVAEIVLGIGTSHSPLLTFGADLWLDRARDDLGNQRLTLCDGRTLSYDMLLKERGPVHDADATEARLSEQAARAGAALDRLANAVQSLAPDVVVIVGDDQDELYRPENTPALAVYYGAEVVMRPLGEMMADKPAWLDRALAGYAMETDNRFSGAPAFGRTLVEGLIDEGIDVAVASLVTDPRIAAFGHAFGFIARRLLRDGAFPILPVLLNTYYPPNVIRPGRCLEIGKSIARVVRAMPEPLRVAVIASGGLSHFVTDESLDRHVLGALARGDAAALTDLPRSALREGSSEILCWLLAGGAFAHLEHHWSDYVPVYRTPAGTGIGLAFGIWQ